MMNLIVGNKWVVIAGIVLAVGLTSFFVTRSIQQAEQDKITIEIQDETNQKRKAIKDAVKDSRPNNPNDATDSLRYLRDRQSD